MPTQDKTLAEEPADTTYQVIADKVGLVPSLRRSDNMFQAKFVGVTTVVMVAWSCLAPWFDAESPWWLLIALGALGGLIVGGILSGLWLGVRNAFR